VVRKRSEHLPHAEPGAAGVAEARLAVLDCNPEGGARINEVAIVRVLAQTGQHADPGIRDDNLEAAWRRGKGYQASLRPAAMSEDIVLQLAHGADDGRGKRFGEPNCDGGLLSSASPERPLIRSIASLSELRQRKRTLACGIAVARDRATVECVFDHRRERRGEANLGEQGGVFAARHQHLNEWAEPTGALDVDLPQCRQVAGLDGPKEIISTGEVAVQLVILSRRCGHPADPPPALSHPTP
jgi:hypothetical protein